MKGTVCSRLLVVLLFVSACVLRAAERSAQFQGQIILDWSGAADSVDKEFTVSDGLMLFTRMASIGGDMSVGIRYFKKSSRELLSQQLVDDARVDLLQSKLAGGRGEGSLWGRSIDGALKDAVEGLGGGFAEGKFLIIVTEGGLDVSPDSAAYMRSFLREGGRVFFMKTGARSIGASEQNLGSWLREVATNSGGAVYDLGETAPRERSRTVLNHFIDIYSRITGQGSSLQTPADGSFGVHGSQKGFLVIQPKGDGLDTKTLSVRPSTQSGGAGAQGWTPPTVDELRQWTVQVHRRLSYPAGSSPVTRSGRWKVLDGTSREQSGVRVVVIGGIGFRPIPPTGIWLRANTDLQLDLGMRSGAGPGRSSNSIVGRLRLNPVNGQAVARGPQTRMLNSVPGEFGTFLGNGLDVAGRYDASLELIERLDDGTEVVVASQDGIGVYVQESPYRPNVAAIPVGGEVGASPGRIGIGGLGPLKLDSTNDLALSLFVDPRTLRECFGKQGAAMGRTINPDVERVVVELASTAGREMTSIPLNRGPAGGDWVGRASITSPGDYRCTYVVTLRTGVTDPNRSGAPLLFEDRVRGRVIRVQNTGYEVNWRAPRNELGAGVPRCDELIYFEGSLTPGNGAEIAGHFLSKIREEQLVLTYTENYGQDSSRSVSNKDKFDYFRDVSIETVGGELRFRGFYAGPRSMSLTGDSLSVGLLLDGDNKAATDPLPMNSRNEKAENVFRVGPRSIKATLFVDYDEQGKFDDLRDLDLCGSGPNQEIVALGARARLRIDLLDEGATVYSQEPTQSAPVEVSAMLIDGGVSEPLHPTVDTNPNVFTTDIFRPGTERSEVRFTVKRSDSRVVEHSFEIGATHVNRPYVTISEWSRPERVRWDQEFELAGEINVGGEDQSLVNDLIAELEGQVLKWSLTRDEAEWDSDRDAGNIVRGGQMIRDDGKLRFEFQILRLNKWGDYTLNLELPRTTTLKTIPFPLKTVVRVERSDFDMALEIDPEDEGLRPLPDGDEIAAFKTFRLFTDEKLVVRVNLDENARAQLPTDAAKRVRVTGNIRGQRQLTFVERNGVHRSNPVPVEFGPFVVEVRASIDGAPTGESRQVFELDGVKRPSPEFSWLPGEPREYYFKYEKAQLGAWLDYEDVANIYSRDWKSDYDLGAKMRRAGQSESFKEWFLDSRSGGSRNRPDRTRVFFDEKGNFDLEFFEVAGSNNTTNEIESADIALRVEESVEFVLTQKGKVRVSSSKPGEGELIPGVPVLVQGTKGPKFVVNGEVHLALLDDQQRELDRVILYEDKEAHSGSFENEPTEGNYTLRVIGFCESGGKEIELFGEYQVGCVQPPVWERYGLAFLVVVALLCALYGGVLVYFLPGYKMVTGGGGDMLGRLRIPFSVFPVLLGLPPRKGSVFRQAPVLVGVVRVFKTGGELKFETEWSRWEWIRSRGKLRGSVYRFGPRHRVLFNPERTEIYPKEIREDTIVLVAAWQVQGDDPCVIATVVSEHEKRLSIRSSTNNKPVVEEEISIGDPRFGKLWVTCRGEKHAEITLTSLS